MRSGKGDVTACGTSPRETSVVNPVTSVKRKYTNVMASFGIKNNRRIFGRPTLRRERVAKIR